MESRRYLGKTALAVALNFYLSVLVVPGYAQQASPTPEVSQASSNAPRADEVPPADQTKPKETVNGEQTTQSFPGEQRVFTLCGPEDINQPVHLPHDVLHLLRKETMSDQEFQVWGCFADDDCPRRNPDAWFAASEIHLHGPDLKDFIVLPKGCWRCLSPVSSCSVWIVRQTPTGHQLVLHSKGGLFFRVLTSSSHGYRNLLLLTNTGATSNIQELFKFDGRRYQAMKTWDNVWGSPRDFSRLISLSPNDAVLYNQRGLAYYHRGQYQPALEDFDHAVRLDPTSAGAYSCNLYYAQAYEEQADPSPTLRVGGLDDPCFHNAHFNRGSVYFELKQYQHAIEDYDEAVRLDPEDAAAYYDRAQAYAVLKQHERAIGDYDQAIRLHFPLEDDAYYKRGLAYQDLKQYDAALQDYDKTIHMNPKHAWLYASRGETYDALQQYPRALQDYNHAIRLKQNADFYNGRGKVYRDLNQFQRAIRDFTHAIGLNTKNADAYYNRGLAYQELKQDSRAQQDFERAEKLKKSEGARP